MGTQAISFCALPPKVYRTNPYLLSGPRPSYADLKELKKEGVKLVVDLRSTESRYYPYLEKLRCFWLGIKHVRRPMKLKNSLPEKTIFEEIAKRINKNKKQTYIHCISGRHRTGMTTCAVNIINEKKAVEDSINVMLDHEYFQTRLTLTDQERSKRIAMLTKRLEEFKKMFGA